MESVADKIKKGENILKEKLQIKNRMALPKLVKVVVNVGTGKAKDKKRNELVADRLAKITGQKVLPRGAKKSIASFKLRQGEIIGQAVTLRGQRMVDFLDRLINVTMPRMRDFKGYNDKCIDEIGNLTFGIKEHTVFPETTDEELRDIFSLAVTIVTTAKNREQARALFDLIGFPFKK